MISPLLSSLTTRVTELWYIYTMIDTNDCWLYAGTINSNGYGLIFSGTTLYAHRVIYEALVGKIGEGLHIDHLCMVRSCINPLHLEPVTRKENILRGNGIAAQCARKTHCKQGHEYTSENTLIKSKGRVCKMCNRHWNRLNRERKNTKVL